MKKRWAKFIEFCSILNRRHFKNFEVIEQHKRCLKSSNNIKDAWNRKQRSKSRCSLLTQPHHNSSKVSFTKCVAILNEIESHPNQRWCRRIYAAIYEEKVCELRPKTADHGMLRHRTDIKTRNPKPMDLQKQKKKFILHVFRFHSKIFN